MIDDGNAWKKPARPLSIGLLFTCVICQRDVNDYSNRNGRDRHLEPTCRRCEAEYGERPLTSGAFMDRRIARQISALAEALHCEANHLAWGMHHGR